MRTLDGDWGHLQAPHCVVGVWPQGPLPTDAGPTPKETPLPANSHSQTSFPNVWGPWRGAPLSHVDLKKL